MNLYETVKKYELISFDIFDTLLLRTVAKPIDVFETIWNRANDIKLTDISPKEFVKLRAEMERRARNKKTSREVTLTDIYSEFPNYIVTDANKLLDIEIETEKEICYCNSTIYQLILNLKKADKKVCLLSDMYLNKNQVSEILEFNGIDISLFDEIIISNEEDCSKQNGELFKVMFEKFPDIIREQILHIGDNKNSDYDQALKQGIAAFHYDAVPDKLNSIYDYEKIRHNIPLPEILSLRKTVVYDNVAEQMYGNVEDKGLSYILKDVKISDVEKETYKEAYEIGASIVGPFLTNFISHVCDRLEKLEIQRIYPLMREGYILGKLLEAEAEHRKIDLEVHPIYVSRMVTYIPSIEKVNREEIENMIGARNLTLNESIKLMGLDMSSFEDVREYGDLRWKDSHKISKNGTTLKEYLINKFLEKDNAKAAEKYIKEQRNYLVRYLKQEIGDFNNAATIDVGFFGRIQLWMEKALSIEGIDCKMKHFLAVGVTGDKIYDGLDFEGYYSTFAENGDLISTIHRTTDILEKFISVTEGSTIGYREKTENDKASSKKTESASIDSKEDKAIKADLVKIEPIKGKAVENDLITYASFYGILDFQKAFHKFAEMKPKAANKVINDRRGALMIMHRLIDMPKRKEAELIRNIEADTNFGTEYKKQIITDENIKLFEEKGADFIDKCNVSYTYQNSSIVWPKGIITLKDEYYYVRRALKSSAGNEIAKSMQEVVERVQADDVKEVALYGAGENGRQFYFMCSLYNIKVNCFIDRKESLWGTKKEGIEIMGLDEAMKRGNDVYIVTSLFSISEISEFIKSKYVGIDRSPIIYSV